MQADDNGYPGNVNDTALRDAKTATWDSNPTRITDARYVYIGIIWWDDPTSRDFHQISINENHTNTEREVLGRTGLWGHADTVMLCLPCELDVVSNLHPPVSLSFLQCSRLTIHPSTTDNI